MELENIVANTIYLKARESEMTKSGSRSKKWREMLALPHVVDVLHLKNELPLSFNYIYLEQPIGKKLFQQFCQEYQQSSPQVTPENRKISTKTQSSDEVFVKPITTPYAKYIHFLNAKKDYVMAEMEDKLSTGQEILQKYLNPQGVNYILGNFNETLLQSPDKFVHTFPHLIKLFRRASEPLRANSPEELQKNDLISNENNINTNNFNIDQVNPTNFIHRIHKLHDMDAILHETENYALHVLSGEAYDIFLESKYFHRYLQFKGLERRPIDKADFRMFRVLGKGGFGEVNACQHRSTGKLYACKTMIKKRIKKRQAEKLTLDEKRILASIDSRFVVNLTYAFQTKDSLCLILTLMSGGDLKYHLQTMVEIREAQNATSFLNTLSGVFIPKGENNNYQNMGPNGENPSEGKGRKRSSLFSTISQLVSGGDGLDVLNPTTTHNKTSKPKTKTKEDTTYVKNDKKISNINTTPVTVFDKDSSVKVTKKPVYAKAGPGGFEPSRARFYAAEIACGLTHLHSKNIIYRDLKPENILVDDAGHIRISDLGLAVQLTGPGFSTKGRVGTVGYMAPEVLLDDHYSFPIDWWSLGCLIYEMIDGKTPFRGYKEKCDKRDINRRVLREETIYFSDRFDQASKDICNKLLEKNPNRRLGSSIRSSHEIANLQNNSGGKSKNTHKTENDIDNISKVPNTTLDITITGKNDDSVQIAMTAGDNKSNTLAENNEIIEKNDNRNNISKTTKKSSITHYSIFDVSSERHILEHAYFTQQLNMAKLKAGKIVPEFVPDPRAVYCKDILDIDQFSSIKGVTLGETDQEFYAKFDTGAVSIPWQNELIETECFRDLNIFSIEHPDSADVTHHDYHTYHKLHHSHHNNLSHGKRNSSLLKNRNNTLPSNQQHPNNSDENSTGSQKFRLGHKARSLDANLNELDGHHTSRNPFTFLKHLVFGRRKSSLHSYYVSTNNNNKSMMPQNTNTQQQGNNETALLTGDRNNPNPQRIDHTTPVKLSNVTTNKTMNNANNAHFVTPFWEKLFHFKVC